MPYLSLREPTLSKVLVPRFWAGLPAAFRIADCLRSVNLKAVVNHMAVHNLARFGTLQQLSLRHLPTSTPKLSTATDRHTVQSSPLRQTGGCAAGG